MFLLILTVHPYLLSVQFPSSIGPALGQFVLRIFSIAFLVYTSHDLTSGLFVSGLVISLALSASLILYMLRAVPSLYPSLWWLAFLLGPPLLIVVIGIVMIFAKHMILAWEYLDYVFIAAFVFSVIALTIGYLKCLWNLEQGIRE